MAPFCLLICTVMAYNCDILGKTSVFQRLCNIGMISLETRLQGVSQLDTMDCCVGERRHYQCQREARVHIELALVFVLCHSVSG